MSNQQDTATTGHLCQECGGPTERIVYPDAAGCGHVLIEMWRCQQCGAVEYGDIVGGLACDADLDDDTFEAIEGKRETWLT